MALAVNIILGLFPTMALAWSIAADERKPSGQRVAETVPDRRRQRVMFLLIYGLWSLTLSMWNWMRSASIAWIALWLCAGLLALTACYMLRRR